MSTETVYSYGYVGGPHRAEIPAGAIIMGVGQMADPRSDRVDERIALVDWRRMVYRVNGGPEMPFPALYIRGNRVRWVPCDENGGAK